MNITEKTLSNPVLVVIVFLPDCTYRIFYIFKSGSKSNAEYKGTCSYGFGNL